MAVFGFFLVYYCLKMWNYRFRDSIYMRTYKYKIPCSVYFGICSVFVLFSKFLFSGYSSEIQDKQISNSETLPEWNDDEERIQGPEICDSNSRLYQAAKE